MFSFKKILVPTDFSDSSKDALRCACELARKFGAEMSLIHVYSPAVTVFPDGYFALPYSLQKDLTVYLENELRKAKQEAEMLIQREVDADLLPGRDFDEIARYAKSGEFDLIVMGSHGRGAVSRFFLGSVTERVLRKTLCNVFVVHGTPDPKLGETESLHSIENQNSQAATMASAASIAIP